MTQEEAISPIRSRLTGMAVTAVLLLSSLGSAGPVAAADSPEGAVNELFDIVVSGDFSRLGEVVCAADQESVRGLFDLGEQLGLDGDASFLDTVSYQVENRSIELLNENGDTATLQITADLSINVEEDRVEGLVRSILEADHGPDDPPVSDDEVALAMGFMGSVFNQSMPLDEEVTVVREDGQWLVCGGLFGGPEEPDNGFEPSVSTEGLCGLVSPDEMSSLGALQYDSSSGFETFCTYSSSDFDTFHSTTVSLSLDDDAESTAAIFGADQPLEIAGAAAYATENDAIAPQLFTQVGEDVLQVSVSLGAAPPEGLDWLTQATLVTELFRPRLADFRLELVGPPPEPTPEPTPEVSLCQALPLDELNDATGLGFDDASGGSEYCGYSSIDGDPGFHNMAVSLTPLSLDDFRAFLIDMEDTTVAGLPAIGDTSQLIVELPGGTWTLTVSAILDPSDEAVTLTVEELMAMVAERVLPNVSVPQDDPFGVPLEEPAAGTAGETALARPLCDYIDLDAVNALGIVEYDTVTGFDPEFCTLSQSDFSAGLSQLSVFVEVFALDEAHSFFPDGHDVNIADRPGYVSDIFVWVDTDAGLISLQATLPDDALAAGVDPSDIMIPVAEMIAAGIEAETQ